MEGKWKPILAEVETVTDRGEPLHLTRVRALQHVETKQIVFNPDDIAQAEIEAIAEMHDLENARDVATFLILFDQPSEGMIKGGDIQYKYHLQKSLFYLWKGLEDEGLYESMPHDMFEGAENGPLPVHLDEDLEKFEKQGLIEIKMKTWKNEFPTLTKYIQLTNLGTQLAKDLWIETPEDYKQSAIRAKNMIYPLSPLQVRDMVHEKYPEFINDTKNDIE